MQNLMMLGDVMIIIWIAFKRGWHEDERYVKNLHPKIQLAITCAFEHFTALLGGISCTDP